MKRLLFIFLFLLVCKTALAQDGLAREGIVTIPTLSWDSDSSVSEGSRSHFLFDFRAGYINDIRMYFGLIFSTQSGSGPNYSVNQTTLGNSFGYFLGNFAAIVSLHLTAKRSEKSGTTNVTLSEGLGYQFDLLYFVPLSSWFALDLVLSYRSLNFNKEQPAGGNLAVVSRNVSHFQPFLGFMIHF